MIRRPLNLVPFVSVHNMMRLVNAVGVEQFLTELAGFVEEDFRRWPAFDKTSRVASHSVDGVIELMPTSDGVTYGFKYVNGHPKNMREGRQTVTAFGLLADVSTGYPELLSEMTILTALRTAATSAVAAKHLARSGSRSMAIIGNGAQSEFQALGFRALIGVDRLRLYDIEPLGEREVRRQSRPLRVRPDDLPQRGGRRRGRRHRHHGDGRQAQRDGADRQPCRRRAAYQCGRRRLPGQDRTAPRHPSALGDFCRISATDAGRRRNSAARRRSSADRTLAGDRRRGSGRRWRDQITLFNSVGFAIEDFSALRYVHSKLAGGDFHEDLDLLADPDEPRDLLGMVHRAETSGSKLPS